MTARQRRAIAPTVATNPTEEAWKGEFPWRRPDRYGVQPEWFDFKNPDYKRVLRERAHMLMQLREDPQLLADVWRWYQKEPADFINDWGMTFDPRNPEIGRPALIPFVLTPKQREWVDWVLWLWRNRRNGLCEKSRDMGVTWLAMALGSTLGIFNRGVVIGAGSRKSDLVDAMGTVDPILPKARMFVAHLPEEFRRGYEEWRDAPKMRVSFPRTGSVIRGETGDDIGRGGRTSIYFVDEAAHLPRPKLVEASLSHTTNCRIDISTPRGLGNPFAQKRFGGKTPVFIFDHTHDPRKGPEWYAEQVEKSDDPVVLAQEVDRDYSASVEGVLIPGIWVNAAIDAHLVLGSEGGPLAFSGAKGIALDVADEGSDKNAICESHGICILRTAEFTGQGSDIFQTVESIFDICDGLGPTGQEYDEFEYDADGLGAGVRGDARVINEQRRTNRQREIRAIAFRGSEGVLDPEAIVDGTQRGDTPGRTNKDMFSNRKAQEWWGLRRRFQNVYRWRVEGIPCPVDDIISISSEDPDYLKLKAELSQPTFKTNVVGKIVINKKPLGMKSPNRADAVMIRFAQKDVPHMNMSPLVAARLQAAGAAAAAARRRR